MHQRLQDVEMGAERGLLRAGPGLFWFAGVVQRVEPVSRAACSHCPTCQPARTSAHACRLRESQILCPIDSSQPKEAMV